jgi:hypothetical protein
MEYWEKSENVREDETDEVHLAGGLEQEERREAQVHRETIDA